MPEKIIMVGAGLSGAVIGRALAEAGHDITVVDSRPHIAGRGHRRHGAHLRTPHFSHRRHRSLGLCQFIHNIRALQKPREINRSKSSVLAAD